MAESTDLQRLVVSLEANLKKYENSMKRASGIAETEGAKIESKFKSVNTNIQAQTSNLAAQFQDIAVSLQGGQSPLTVALQQGTQIGAVLGPAGAAGAVRALGGAFLSVLSPVNLATIGLIAAGGAAIKYFTSAADVKSLDDLIKEHAETIALIEEQYGKAVAGAENYVKVTGEVMAGRLSAQQAALVDQMQKLGQQIAASLGSSLPAVDELSARFGGLENSINVGKFDIFREAIVRFQQSVAAGSPDFVRLREEVYRLTNEAGPASAETQRLALQIDDLAKKGVEAQQQMERVAGSMKVVGDSATATAAMVSAFSGALKSLQGISFNLDDRARAYEQYSIAVGNAAGDVVKLQNAEMEYIRAKNRADMADAEKNKPKATKASTPETPPRDRYADTVAYLELEIQKAGLVGEARDAILAKEREIQMLRRAGVTTLSEEGQNIIRLVQLEAQREAAAKKVAEANRSIQEAGTYAGNELVGALDGMISRGRELDDVLQDVIKSLIRAALQAAILGQGPLAGVLGLSGANGAAGGLIGGLLPGKAAGGPVQAGRAYKVGERGMETFVPSVDGMIVPNNATPAASRQGGAIAFAPSWNIDARGAQIGVAEQMRAVIEQNNRMWFRQLPALLRSSQKRFA